MDTRARRTGLRALAHPATLLSISLLLLNDHYLKAAAPCWLTGKLSDLAGLFFFPFLLAVLLGLLLARLRPLSPLALGWISFALTALCFAAVKATPWGNDLAVRLTSALLQHSASIARDPSDLLALIALWPAWVLWRGAARAPLRLPGRLSWAALALASVATLATSVPPVEYVRRIVVLEGQTYALTEYLYTPVSDTRYRFFQTSDDGRTWSELEDVPPALKKEKPRAAGETILVNDPRRPAGRYRLQSGSDRLERSDDAGHSWVTAWKIPSGRREFMERLQRFGVPSIGLYDLAFAPDGSALIVAMGSAGVLVRDEAGAWNRYVVGWAEPIPFSSISLFGILGREMLLCVLSVFPLAVLLTAVAWVAMAPLIGRKGVWGAVPLFLELCLLVVVILGLTGSRSLFGVAYQETQMVAFLFPLFVLVCSPAVWLVLRAAAKDRTAGGRAMDGCLITALVVPAAVLLSLILWGVGVIPWYEAALAVGLIAGAIVLVTGAARVYRHARAAALGPPMIDNPAPMPDDQVNGGLL